MPISPPILLSRRRFIAATTGLAGLAVIGGCSEALPASEPDPLNGLAAAAARDARELAAADASHGSATAGLKKIAEVRRVHAKHLADEVGREAGDEPTPDDGDQADESNSPGEPDPATPSTVVCPPIDEVLARLRADARTASEFAVSAEGYRAELAAAVSAACTAAVEVILT